MLRNACAALLLASSALATDYEEGSFASLAPKATAHFADEFDRRGLQSLTEHGQCGGGGGVSSYSLIDRVCFREI